MKIFNVSLRVQINQIAHIPDNPAEPAPKEPFNDDPLDKQKKILDSYMDRVERMNAPRLVGPGFATESESASMNRSVQVQAETFEDLSAILQKFSDTLKQIPAVDPSLLKVAEPTIPSMPQYG